MQLFSPNMDPTFPLVPILNFVCSILVLSPLYIRALRPGLWNIPIVAFSLWISIECITTGVNSVIWSNNVEDIAPVWCDISKSLPSILHAFLIQLYFAATHLDIASSMAVRGCTFATTRRLYIITQCKEVDTYRKV